jgi:hypothetical protein
MVAVSSILLTLLACCSPAPPPPEPEATTTSAPASPESELADIKTRLEAAKTALFDEGKYNCCVEPSCDWCALHEGSCGCFTNLQAGDAVCPGCGLGWHNGQGIVEGIDAKDVKWNITHEHAAGGHQH